MTLEQWKVQAQIDSRAFDQLTSFVKLLLEWNSRINLTGFRTATEIEEALIGPCISALEIVSFRGPAVLDFGSGAGIPGLVWAACRPELRVTSLEIRQKKVTFQKEVLRRTAIQAEIISGRFPEAVMDRKLDVIVTRAIRFSTELWDAAEALVNPGGLLVRFASNADPNWTSVKIGEKSFVLYTKV